MERKKDGAVKEELPRSVVSNMVLEIRGQRTAGGMKGRSQSKSETQPWMGPVMEAGSAL